MGSILSFLGGALAGIGNVLFSVLSGGFSAASSLIKQAMGGIMEYHKTGIEFARGMGMSLQQAQAYTNVLTERAQRLAITYGLSVEAVKELQANLAEASGKAVMLNDVDAEKFVQINKLVGSNVAKQFTSTIMTSLGGQLRTVEGAVSKAYATAAKSGLNAAQFSDKVAKNLSLANKLSFRDGVNGIIRMTALSEKLGFNLQSVEQAASNFMELDKAIEHSAQLQMLGGAAGAYGSNPLLMSYEANYDPEAFTERMTKTLGGYATFDAKTSMANVNGMNRDFVKSIAQAMGISMDEAMTIAKKQAEVKYKESQFGAEIRSRGYSKQQEDYIINSSYIGEDGRLKMTDMNGKEQDVDTLVQNGQLDQMMSMENKSDEQIMRDQAMQLTSINEKLEGLETSSIAALAKSINAELPKIMDLIETFAPTIIEQAENLGQKAAAAVNDVITFIKSNTGFITDLIKGISKFLGLILDNFKWLLLAYAGTKILGMLGNIWGLFRGGFGLIRGQGGRVSGSARATTKALRGVTNASKGMFLNNRAAYSLNRGAGDGIIKSILKSPVQSFKALSTGAKFLTAGSTVLGAGIGLYDTISSINGYSSQKDQLDEQLRNGAISKAQYNTQLSEAKTARNEGIGGGVGTAVGTVIGTAIGGPIGAAVGGWLGNVGGEFIGKHWESITNAVSDAWNWVTNGVSDAWNWVTNGVSDAWGAVTDGVSAAWNWVTNGVSNAWGAVTDGVGAAWNGVTGFVTNAWSTVTNGVSDAWNWVTNGVSDAWSTVTNGVSDAWNGSIDTITNVATNMWNGISDIAASVFSGIGDFLGGIFGTLGDAIGDAWDWTTGAISDAADWVGNAASDAWDFVSSGFGLFSKGGVVGGNQTEGDNVLVRVNSGEMVLNPDQQSKLFGLIDGLPGSLINGLFGNDIISTFSGAVSGVWDGITSLFGGVADTLTSGANGLWDTVSRLFDGVTSAFSSTASGVFDTFGSVATSVWDGITGLFGGGSSDVAKSIQNSADLVSSVASSILTNTNDVIAKPVGEREYIYEPRGTEVSNVNGNQITVNDINVKINGTIKLDAGNSSRELELSKLLNDSQFISSLKEIIKTSMNNDVNGGRFMNDTAQMRGLPSQTALWGRR